MLTNHTAYKYETPYKVTFVITQFFTNDAVNLKHGTTQIKYNICRMNPYKLDTNVKYSSSINMSNGINKLFTRYILLFKY